MGKISAWISNVDGTSYPRLENEIEVDVAIIGGGIAGASAAYYLSPHRDVLLLERESALGYHSSGRSAAELAPRFHSDVVRRLIEISYGFLTTPPAGFTDVKMVRSVCIR